MTAAADLLHRYLQQRRDLGEVELVLEDAEAIHRALQAGSGRAEHATDRAMERAPAKLADQRPSLRPDPPSAAGSTVVSATSMADAAVVGSPMAPRAEPKHPPAIAPIVPAVRADLPANHPLTVLNVAANGCTACGLAATRTTVVFGEGNPQAELMVIGEAPGADEDRTGRPFVGKAGALLNSLLQSVGFTRESVYICNTVKCRPPGNRNPLPAEMEACSHFLRGQLKAISPRAILTVGTVPSQALLETSEAIGRLRGTVHSFEGIPLVPTYHPAALLRNPGWIRPVWEDLQKLRRVLDAG